MVEKNRIFKETMLQRRHTYLQLLPINDNPSLGDALVVVLPRQANEANEDESADDDDVESPGDGGFDVALVCRSRAGQLPEVRGIRRKGEPTEARPKVKAVIRSELMYDKRSRDDEASGVD